VPDNPRIEELRRRVQKDPASIAFAQLAEEYRRAGNYEEAVHVCRSGLDKHPSYLSARVTLGRALIELGEFDDSQGELEYVLRSAPENLAAIRGLAEIYHRRGELGEALKQYRAALAIAKHDPDLEQTVQDLARQVGGASTASHAVPPPLAPAPSVSEVQATPPPISPSAQDLPFEPTPMDAGEELGAAAEEFTKALDALDTFAVETSTTPPLPAPVVEPVDATVENDARVVEPTDLELSGFDAAWANRQEPDETLPTIDFPAAIEPPPAPSIEIPPIPSVNVPVVVTFEQAAPPYDDLACAGETSGADAASITGEAAAPPEAVETQSAAANETDIETSAEVAGAPIAELCEPATSTPDVTPSADVAAPPQIETPVMATSDVGSSAPISEPPEPPCETQMMPTDGADCRTEGSAFPASHGVGAATADVVESTPHEVVTLSDQVALTTTDAATVKTADDVTRSEFDDGTVAATAEPAAEPIVECATAKSIEINVAAASELAGAAIIGSPVAVSDPAFAAALDLPSVATMEPDAVPTAEDLALQELENWLAAIIEDREPRPSDSRF
jgi:Tetratricopeptide repeat